MNEKTEIQNYFTSIKHTLNIYEDEKSPNLKLLIEKDLKSLDLLISYYKSNQEIKTSYDTLKKRYERSL